MRMSAPGLGFAARHGNGPRGVAEPRLLAVGERQAVRFDAGLFGPASHGIAPSVQNAVIALCVGCALLPTKTVQGVRSGYAETTLSAVGASTRVLGT